MNLNRTVLAGNLTRDPEVKYTPKGTAVCEFSIAVNRVWTDGDGNKHEEADFFNCVAWGKTAENIGKHFTKGKAIYIEARLKNESWDDKQTGQKRYKTCIIAETFQFVGGKSDGANSGGRQQREEDYGSAPAPGTGYGPRGQQQPPRRPPAPPPVPDPDLDPPEDDDIPF